MHRSKFGDLLSLQRLHPARQVQAGRSHSQHWRKRQWFRYHRSHNDGRGKRVVRMDGLGLYDKLSRELQLNLALKRKMRRVAVQAAVRPDPR